MVSVKFAPWVEEKSSWEPSSPSHEQLSSDVEKDSGVESPQLSPEPKEDVNSQISAVEEGSWSEDQSHSKGSISPWQNASL